MTGSPSVLGTGLLAPDPELPHRDVLLDPELARTRLEQVLGLGPMQECERLRAKYRIGESLRAVYRIRVRGAEQVVSARMFRPGRAAREVAPGILDESIETVFWLFPDDRKLRRPDWLATVPEDLREVFGEPWRTGLVAAYTPERALTVRCLSGSGTSLGYAKTFHTDLPPDAAPDADPAAGEALRSQAILAGARAGLAAGSPLRLARPLGYHPRHRVALYSAVRGVPLAGVPWQPPVLAALGRALAALHERPTTALPGPDCGSVRTRLNPARIRRSAELIGLALPSRAGAAHRVADLLLGSMPAATSPDVHLHGDVHPANVLVQPDGIGLVDLDQASIGPAAADLGPLLARLRLPAQKDRIGPAGGPLAAAALLDGYGRSRPADGELAWYGAAALLIERALRSVNCVRPDGLAQLSAVLGTAASWLEDR